MVICLFFWTLYLMPNSIFSAAMPSQGQELYKFLQNYPSEQASLDYIAKNPLSMQDVHYAHPVSGSTLLMEAARLSYFDLFESLLAKKALVNIVDKNGTSALGHATSKLAHPKEDPAYAQKIAATHKIIDTILGQSDINLEIADKWGYTPLITATQGNHLDLVQKLVAAGANKLARNYCNETALVVAQRKGYAEIVAYLETVARKKPSRSDEPFFQSSDSSD